MRFQNFFTHINIISLSRLCPTGPSISLIPLSSPTIFLATPTNACYDTYKITGYTASTQTKIAIGGTQLTNGIDYISYVDTVNQIAYVKLMRPIVAGSATGNQLNSGLITISQ